MAGIGQVECIRECTGMHLVDTMQIDRIECMVMHLMNEGNGHWLMPV